MSAGTLYSVIESPTHPNLSGLYRRLQLRETQLTSIRKANSAVKKNPPDFVVAEFFYGFGNNYAGVNVCNLDVLLVTMQRYAPDARMIVLVDKSEAGYVEKLKALFPLHAVLVHPVSEAAMEAVLTA